MSQERQALEAMPNEKLVEALNEITLDVRGWLLDKKNNLIYSNSQVVEEAARRLSQMEIK